MKLSIVTINYNDAIGLERTIQSVITQTFKDFEYIIIDGNSTDGSKEIIKKYSEKIQVAISEPVDTDAESAGCGVFFSDQREHASIRTIYFK